MWRALELERHYSKAQLLEAYLNLAPYGRNIEGIGAAREIYFGKDARSLTRHEAVALSVVPQSPTRRALQVARTNRALAPARDRLLARLTNGQDEIERGFVARAKARRNLLAPHFTTEVLHE
jgi:membrane carboxypeptidase/penicillin-binding protein PbpC